MINTLMLLVAVALPRVCKYIRPLTPVIKSCHCLMVKQSYQANACQSADTAACCCRHLPSPICSVQCRRGTGSRHCRSSLHYSCTACLAQPWDLARISKVIAPSIKHPSLAYKRRPSCTCWTKAVLEDVRHT